MIVFIFTVLRRFFVVTTTPVLFYIQVMIQTEIYLACTLI